MYGNLNKWFFPAMLLATLYGCQKSDLVTQKEDAGCEGTGQSRADNGFFGPDHRR